MKWEIWVADNNGDSVLEDVGSYQMEFPTDRIGWTKVETFEAENWEEAKKYYEGFLETYDCR